MWPQFGRVGANVIPLGPRLYEKLEQCVELPQIKISARFERNETHAGGLDRRRKSLGRRHNDVVSASFCHTRDGEKRIQMARLGRGCD